MYAWNPGEGIELSRVGPWHAYHYPSLSLVDDANATARLGLTTCMAGTAWKMVGT